MIRTASAVLFGCCLLAGFAFAQITIEAGDVPRTIGDSFQNKYVQTEATVNVGSPGGPHTWTFDTSTYVGYVLTTTIVDKASTPFADRFPDANLATREPRGQYTLYVYNQVVPEELRECGYGVYLGPGGIVRVNVPPAVNVPFPATLGTSWQTGFTVSDTSHDTVRVAVNDRRCVIDAWGTAITPAGTYPCLRENWTGLVVTTTYVGGSPVDVDTSLTRRYLWMAKGVGVVALAHSMEGDTSLNFTQADDYTVLAQTSAGGIQEPGLAPVRPRPSLWPNPCAGRSARLGFGATGSPALVRVYDATGRNVLLRSVPAGTRSVELDVGSLPSGVHVVEARARTQLVIAR